MCCGCVAGVSRCAVEIGFQARFSRMVNVAHAHDFTLRPAFRVAGVGVRMH